MTELTRNEVAKLTPEEAKSALDDSVSLIESMRPPQPTWMTIYDPKTPLRRMDSDVFLTIWLSSVGSFIVSTVISGLVFEHSWILALIATFGGGIGLAGLSSSLFLTKHIASTYGGSKKKQPIRRMLAKRLFSKEELDELEYRVREYEVYAQALEAHQIVIDREREKLEEQQVFTILATGREMKTLDSNGHLAITSRPLSEVRVGEQFDEVALRISNYLQDEKKAITGKVDSSQ